MENECCYKNKLEIALLKRDIETMRDTFHQADASINKLEKIANNISKETLLQQQHLNTQDKLLADIEKVLESQRKENNDDIEKLNTKINNVNIELTTKINQTENAIVNELHKIKSDLTEKISEIDMYRYMVMGAIAFGVFLLTKAVDVVKLFN